MTLTEETNDPETLDTREEPVTPEEPVDNAAFVAPDSAGREQTKPSYKTVPENWKAIPPGRFGKAIGHLEAVLLEISADGTLTSNLFDWKPPLPTLQAWAEHLRAALRDLSR